MSQWYVKDLSKLTGVSAQTLHHYDRIGLLKPSVRLPNGYRLYTENDLLRLQQIIALKFFGFELANIKHLLAGQVDMQEHLALQAQFLKEKAESLLEASNTLSQIVSSCENGKSISWENIIPLIEIYRTTQKLEKTWRGKVFPPKELKEYAKLMLHFPEEKVKRFEQEWNRIVQLVRSNINKDSHSNIALEIAKEGMDCINSLFGKEHAHVRHYVWENGFKKGKVQDKYGLSIEEALWLDQTFHAYYDQCIQNLLNRVGLEDGIVLEDQWNTLLEDMYGYDQALRQTVIEAAIADVRVSEKARTWLLGFGFEVAK